MNLNYSDIPKSGWFMIGAFTISLCFSILFVLASGMGNLGPKSLTPSILMVIISVVAIAFFTFFPYQKKIKKQKHLQIIKEKSHET